MIYKSLKLISVLTLVALLFSACKKEEGEGGTSTITGKVILHDYDGSFQTVLPKDIRGLEKEDVYIIYGGDKSTYDDDFKTAPDGSYEFKHLQVGHYRLFAYTKDSTGAYNGTFVDNTALNLPVYVDVEITSNGSTVTAPDIIVLDNNQ